MNTSQIQNIKRQVVFIVKNELEGLIEGIVATNHLDFAKDKFLPYAFQDQINSGNIKLPIDAEHYGLYGETENIWYEDDGKILKFSGKLNELGKNNILPLILQGELKGVSGEFTWSKNDTITENKQGVEINVIRKANLNKVSIVKDPVQSQAVITRLKSMDANGGKKQVIKSIAQDGNLKMLKDYISKNYNISKKQSDLIIDTVISTYQNRKNLTNKKDNIEQNTSAEMADKKPLESEGGNMPNDNNNINDLINHIKVLLQN